MDPAYSTGVNRRRFIGLGVAGLAGGLLGCTTSAPSIAPASTPTPSIPLPPRGLYVRTIRDRGRLIVGTYRDTFFSTWDPQLRTVLGFDADIAREIAKDLFGDAERIEWKEITSATRIAALQEGIVDVVVASMTITPERLQQVDFSDVYYESAQMLLVPKASGLRAIEDTAGKLLCAAKGSTSVANIRRLQPAATIVQVVDWHECLVALQNGDVDGISTDQTILIGMAAHDERLALVGGKLTYEPYGIGVPKGRAGFVSFINGVLIRAKLDGRWAKIHEKWLGKYLPAPSPPTRPALEAAV